SSGCRGSASRAPRPPPARAVALIRAIRGKLRTRRGGRAARALRCPPPKRDRPLDGTLPRLVAVLGRHAPAAGAAGAGPGRRRDRPGQLSDLGAVRGGGPPVALGL